MNKLVSLLFVCCLSFATPIFGQDVKQFNEDEIGKFINRMVSKHQFDQKELLEIFKQVERKQKVIDSISRPAERVLEWHEYRNIFLTDKRIRLGKEFIKKHQSALLRAQDQFGVPPEVVTAIIGVETYYGEHRGRYRVIDALSTLAFDYPRRKKFFTKELEQFFLLAREQGFSPLELMGSYAGAMGYSQFIPSSYRHYAIDFDQDQVVDLFNNQTDAIGSVASYLKIHGWSRQGKIAVPAKLTKNEKKYRFPKGYKLSQTVKGLKSAGVDFFVPEPSSKKARLLKLKGEIGKEYWVVLQNFYAITRYNYSDLYAMAVFQLSEALKHQSEESL